MPSTMRSWLQRQARGPAETPHYGAVVVVDHEAPAAKNLFATALQTTKANMKVLIIELNSNSKNMPYPAEMETARQRALAWGIECVQIKPHKLVFNLKTYCCCLSVNGKKLHADMVISSNARLPAVKLQTLPDTTRVTRNGYVTAICTGQAWILHEPAILRSLHLQQRVSWSALYMCSEALNNSKDTCGASKRPSTTHTDLCSESSGCDSDNDTPTAAAAAPTSRVLGVSPFFRGAAGMLQ